MMRSDLGQPVVNIVGERVALGPTRRDLLPLVTRWHNDLAALEALGDVPRPLTLEATTQRLDAFEAAPDEVRFCVYERATRRPIGLTSLPGINYRNGTARYILFIGAADCRGQGYGTEVTRLMLDYAFTALGLHSVLLTVYAYNLAGLRAYEKAGFREVGRHREAHRRGGQRWDVIYMDCLAREFESSALSTIFVPDEPRS
jgi:RimJ/RimL family protein N-acetyltransferase